MQPGPYVQWAIAFAALCIAAAAVTYVVTASREERNAHLVEIGVSILRADPKKEPSAAAARQWALDLIDANSGQKFSAEARNQLLEEALTYKPVHGVDAGSYYLGGGDLSYSISPKKNSN